MDPEIAYNTLALNIGIMSNMLDNGFNEHEAVRCMEEAVTAFHNLDEWLKKGGFKPKVWQ